MLLVFSGEDSDSFRLPGVASGPADDAYWTIPLTTLRDDETEAHAATRAIAAQHLGFTTNVSQHSLLVPLNAHADVMAYAPKK